MLIMDAVVAVAIGVLATVFLGSLIALIVVCRHKYCKKMDLISLQTKDMRPDVQLIDGCQDLISDLELDDVHITSPNLEEILDDERWVDDATGLVPHCISILKTCHHLTEKLVAMTMGNVTYPRSQECLENIIMVAKRISPRVDDVVRSMYPPLDPRLLEARSTALFLSVNHLVLMTKAVSYFPTSMDWIEESLTEMDSHLKVLREAALAAESNANRTPSNSISSSNDSQQAMLIITKPIEPLRSESSVV